MFREREREREMRFPSGGERGGERRGQDRYLGELVRRRQVTFCLHTCNTAAILCMYACVFVFFSGGAESLPWTPHLPLFWTFPSPHILPLVSRV